MKILNIVAVIFCAYDLLFVKLDAMLAIILAVLLVLNLFIIFNRPILKSKEERKDPVTDLEDDILL